MLVHRNVTADKPQEVGFLVLFFMHIISIFQGCGLQNVCREWASMNGWIRLNAMHSSSCLITEFYCWTISIKIVWNTFVCYILGYQLTVHNIQWYDSMLMHYKIYISYQAICAILKCLMLSFMKLNKCYCFIIYVKMIDKTLVYVLFQCFK